MAVIGKVYAEAVVAAPEAPAQTPTANVVKTPAPEAPKVPAAKKSAE